MTGGCEYGAKSDFNIIGNGDCPLCDIWPLRTGCLLRMKNGEKK